MERVEGVGRVNVFSTDRAVDRTKDAVKNELKKPRELEKQNEEIKNQNKPNPEEIETFKDNLEKLKKIFRGQAEFEIDKETHMVIVRIKDPDSGDIIRQIPPEVAVKLSKNIAELLGVLMDERV